jgi:hypothetical protein
MLTEMFMRVIGLMIKPTVEEFTFMPMEQNMWESGRMINNMVRVRNPGLMGRNMLGNTTKEKNMGKVLFTLLMEAGIKAASITMILRVREYIFGQMKGNMKAVGLEIKCMGKEKLFGLMEDLMRGIMKMIRNMAMVALYGQMEESIQENGKEESNTVEELT